MATLYDLEDLGDDTSTHYMNNQLELCGVYVRLLLTCLTTLTKCEAKEDGMNTRPLVK